MIQRVFITVIFCFAFQFCYSQEKDKVYLKNKEVVEGKILKVTSDKIEIDPTGDIPFNLIDRDKVKLIIYSDNTIVSFDENKDENSPKSTNQIRQKTNLTKEVGEMKTQTESFPTSEKDVLILATDQLKLLQESVKEISTKPIDKNSNTFPEFFSREQIRMHKIKRIIANYSKVICCFTPTLYSNIKETWDYDKSGNLIEKVEVFDSRVVLIASYNYDSFDRIVKSEHFSEAKIQMGKKSSTKQYEYYEYTGDTTIIKKIENSILKELTLKYKNIRIFIKPEYKIISSHAFVKKQLNNNSYIFDYVSGGNKYLFKNDKLLERVTTTFSKKYQYDKKGRLIRIMDNGKPNYKVFYNSKGLVKKTIDYYDDVRIFKYEFYN